MLLVHGWRVRDPMRTIGRLIGPLAALGYSPLLLRYGYTLTPASTRHHTRKAAKNWAPRTTPGDVVIGHSNGCNLAWELSHDADNRADAMVWINPALDPDCIPGRSVSRLLVLYNQADWAVGLASFLPFSIWGEMGRRGYCAPSHDPFGADPRITCAAHGHGHSDWRNPDALAAVIHDFVAARDRSADSATPGAAA